MGIFLPDLRLVELETTIVGNSGQYPSQNTNGSVVAPAESTEQRNMGPSKTIIAYLGPPSSYTHQAADDSFGTSNYVLEYQPSIRDVFAIVQSSAAIFGVVPFENSSNGPVIDTLDLLIDREGDYPNVQVCGEAYINIQHCLLGYVSRSAYQGNLGLQQNASGSATPTMSIPFPRKPRSKPTTDLQHIKRIISHPQAFGQSEAFLSTYLKSAERYEVSSTSEAARIAASDESGEAAAIASKLAADVHGLTILAEGIQDVDDNTTRFLIIQRGPIDEEKQMLLPEKLRVPAASDSNRKSLMAFSVNHETQGALAKALLVFSKHGLNLTSINNRPSRIRAWHYNWLVEFEGKKVLQDPELLRLALEELDTATEGNKWLGCWKDRFRR